MEHKVKSSWKEGLHFEIETGQGIINVDGAEDFGGQGKGHRSKPLMLASLAGCTGMDVASLIKKMHLDVESFSLEVEGDLTEEHPKMYKSVMIKYLFKGANLNEEKLKKAVDLSVDKYCGVIAMFKSFAEVNIDIQFN